MPLSADVRIHRPRSRAGPLLAGLGTAGLALAAAGSAGCAHRAVEGGPAGRAAESAPTNLLRLPLPGLVDVACPSDGCVALTSLGLLRVPTLTPVDVRVPAGATGLGVDAGALWVAAPCPEAAGTCRWALGGDPPTLTPGPAVVEPAVVLLDDPPPLASAVPAFTAAWNAAIAHRWRVPFRHTIVGPGGSPITVSRGSGGTGQILRAGSPPQIVRVPIAASPVSWPAPIALHPSGQELYLVSWPGASVRAIDPLTLATRWTVGLEGAAQGLFVDPDGRFLLLAEGPEATDRLLDWPLVGDSPDAPGGAAPLDPTRDEALRAEPRPPMESAVLVDLATHDVAARVRGVYRRFVIVPGSPARVVLATDQELVFYTLPEPPA